MEFLLGLVRVEAEGVALGWSDLRGGVAANGHGLPGHALQIAARPGGIGAGKIVVHTGNLNNGAGQPQRGVVGIHLPDRAAAGDLRRVAEGDGDRIASAVGQRHVFRPGVVDFIASRRRGFRHGVGVGVQAREGDGPVRPGHNILGIGPIDGLHMELRPGETQGGIRGVHFPDSQLIGLLCAVGPQLPDDHLLDGGGRVQRRARAGEGVLIDIALAPDLHAQVEDVLGPVPEGLPVALLVDVRVLHPLQGVVDVHEFLGAALHGVVQRPLLIAPEDGLDPGIHVPGVLGLPDRVDAGGHRSIRKRAGGVGVIVRHHHAHRGICDGGGVAPGLALQSGTHIAALGAAEAYGGFAAAVVVHLVQLAAAQARRLIRYAGVTKPLQGDGIGAPCREGRRGQQRQECQQSQKQGYDSLFHKALSGRERQGQPTRKAAAVPSSHGLICRFRV